MKLIPTHQFVAEGLDSANIRSLVKSGEIRRARRGVYVEGRPAADRLEWHAIELAAALQLAGDQVVASHWSAALLWKLPVTSEYLSTLWLSSPGSGGGYARSDARKHVVRLDAADVCEIAGLRATTLARTVADLTRIASFERGVVLADAALRQGLTDAQLQQQLVAAKRLKGVPRARAVAAFADARAESPMESIARVAIQRAGVPMPELQRNIYSEAGVWLARVDFCWEAQRLIGEYDGEDKYTLDPNRRPAEAFAAEKARDLKLRAANWSVVHWGKADLADQVSFGRRLRADLLDAEHRWRSR